MGKIRETSIGSHKSKSSNKATKTRSSTLDPALTALFESSIPRAAPRLSRTSHSVLKLSEDRGRLLTAEEEAENDEPTSSEEEHDSESKTVLPVEPVVNRKRKRASRGEEIEDRYLKKLALDEEKDRLAKRKLGKNAARQDSHVKATPKVSEQQTEEDIDYDTASQSSQMVDIGETEDVDAEIYEVPQHESLAAAGSTTEIDKAARTVFLGNVSIEAIRSKTSKRSLLEHLVSFTSDMKDSSDHQIESIRFRSTAFSDSSIPKKAAFAKQQLMDATTKSTNAYVVYSTTAAAREATRKLNGTLVLGRHLRVDSVAHPAAVDHRRCVFVGNLGFVDDESNIRANETEDGQKRPKAKEAADVEEGLWVHFAKVGPVESVRVVRDRTTRVGKGIAYVQFKDPNSVEKALLMNDKKFPPMLPRKLRVTRAKKPRKTISAKSKIMLSNSGDKATHRSRQPEKLHSLAGRADRMLGRAGAHHVRKALKQGSAATKDVIFEGHRAVPRRGPMVTKDRKKKRRDRRTDRSLAHRTRIGRT